MIRNLALTFIFTLSALGCSSQQTDDEYWCSYETDPEAHKHCLEVGKDLDEQTAESAGKKVNP